jgi:3-phytase
MNVKWNIIMMPPYVRMVFFIWVMLLIVVVSSCKGKAEEPVAINEENTGAWEDSFKMEEVLAMQALIINRITADSETDPVKSFPGEDVAGDPAIWLNPNDPEKSLIIGTNKKSGIEVYDLEGTTIQIINAGIFNDVDLRDGFWFMDKAVTLLAGSNCNNNSITMFYIDPDKGLISDSICNIPSQMDTIFGLCMYKDLKTLRYYVFVNGKGGQVEQWEIRSKNQEIDAELMRTIKAERQTESMVADDANGRLYLGVEEEGIFSIEADPGKTPLFRKIAGSDTDNPHIKYDIEGLALFEYHEETFLVASIQGNFSYAIFETGKHERYLTSFVIEDGIVDGAEETEGIEIYPFPISVKYPEGLMVVQDGYNFSGETLENQNFKLVPLDEVSELVE